MRLPRCHVPNWVFKAKHIAPVIVLLVIIIVQLEELERKELLHRYANSTTAVVPDNSTLVYSQANATQF